MSHLLDEQRLLQKEAEQVVELLQLESILSSIGRPIRVGSSAMGLMVRRDIDITVVCKNLDLETRTAFAHIGAKFILMDRHVVSVRFRNDTGVWNADPASYPDGLYICLSVRTFDGADWTVDIWAVDQPERQPDLMHLRTLLPRIAIILRSEKRLPALSSSVHQLIGTARAIRNLRSPTEFSVRYNYL